MIRTCQKQGRNFLQYGLEVIRAASAGQTPPLPSTALPQVKSPGPNAAPNALRATTA